MLPLDGIWIDMNEIANFCENGDCRDGLLDGKHTFQNTTGVGIFGESFDPNNPPYKIDNAGKGRSAGWLAKHALS